MKTLATEVGISETQGRKYVKELERELFIIVDRRNRHYRKDGSGGSNGYYFLWHKALEGETGEQKKLPPPHQRTTGVGHRKTDGATPAETCTQRESPITQSAKESQIKADTQLTDCKKRCPSAVDSSASVVPKSKEPAIRYEWDDEDLEQVECFLEENEPADMEDHGNIEWLPEAILDAGLGADADEVLTFLESMVASNWTAPSYRAYPAVVRHEFERRRNKAAGRLWSDSERANIRTRLKRYMDDDEPPEGFEDSCELRANGATGTEVVALIDRKWSKPRFRPGAKHGPRSWNWFLKVIGNEFSVTERAHLPEAPAAPPSAEYGRDSEAFERATAAFDSLNR
jgi:hypothetical protein